MGNIRKLKEIAGRQSGYFTTRQAGNAGFRNDLRHYHVTRGHWLRIERSVYRFAGYPDSLEACFVRWSLWAIGRDQERKIAISHESAMHYYGLQEECPAQTHLSISSPIQRQELPADCVLHLTDLADGDYDCRPGFHITTPYRTLCDLRPDLVYRNSWLHTVRLAQEKGLVEKEIARKLIGDTSYQQMLNTEQAHARTGPVAHATIVETTVVGDIERSTGMSDMYGRVHMEIRGKRSEWRVPNRSFTLIELLVVIAIVAILSALLMPMLNSAQEQARSTFCRGNMKQQGTMMLSYTTDFGFYAGKNFARVCNTLYFNGMYAYYERIPWNVCPSSPEENVMGAIRHNYWLSGVFFSSTQYFASYQNDICVRASRVKSPSNKIYLTEFYSATMDMSKFTDLNHLNDRIVTNMHRGIGNLLAADGHAAVAKLPWIPSFASTQNYPSDACYQPLNPTNVSF